MDFLYYLFNLILQFIDFGSITKIDLETGTVWKYYSDKLLLYNFINENSENNTGDFRTYEESELIEERNHDHQFNDKIIVLEHYSQFNKDDKEIIEELFVELVTARKSMSLKQQHKLGLENYLE